MSHIGLLDSIDLARPSRSVGNGSDEVLAHAFAALLKQPRPVLFPDVTYSFYPVYCRLLGVDHQTVPLDAEMRVRIADYRGRGGSIIIANPNAPTGIALSRAEIERLVSERADAPSAPDTAGLGPLRADGFGRKAAGRSPIRMGF